MKKIAYWKFLIVFALVGFVHTAAVYAQPQLKAAVSTNTYKALIGEQLQLTLSFTQTNKGAVDWPLISDTIGGFEILKRSEVDTLIDEAGTITYAQQLVVTTFDSGFYRIPALTFYLGDSIPILSAPIGIDIHTVPVDTAQAFKDIKDPLEVPATLMDYLPYALAGVLALAIIGGLIYVFFFRKKKPEQVVEKVKIRVPIHEVAMRKLALLEEKKLWQQGETKAYYSELTDIIREYIEGRYQVAALESTTDEILSGLQDQSMPPAQMNKLTSLLQRADLVKFAKYKPEPSGQLQEMDTAREFVKVTKTLPKPVTPSEENPEKAETA